MRLLRAEVCELSQATLWIAAKCSVLNKLFEVQGVDNVCSATTYTYMLKTIVSRGTYGGIRLAVDGLNVLTGELYNLRDKCLLVAIQIPKVLAWLDYVQWKFKLLSTGWWSVKNESLVEIQLPIMKFSDATVVQKNNREDLMVFSNLFSASLRSMEKSCGTIWLGVELPGAPGYMRSCHFLFDRGKILECTPRSSLSIIDRRSLPHNIHNSEQLEVNIWFVAKCFLPRQLERVKEMAENLYHLIQLVDINSKQLGSLDVVGLTTRPCISVLHP
ncbi:uncharacterized protein LOC113350386 [Papaver somniferum]|uniref:uncharacterized protein LOC113350386 n=1 Tax=Papaver somniferum TaxID=3469 RepID=UPI000E70049F|nr:uncharacterized protein LOC113350386 [Papaver somniferum]